MYLSGGGTYWWLVGDDPSKFTGYVLFGSPHFLPFFPIQSTPMYWANTNWIYVTANVIRVTCIEDNNY